MFKNLINVIKTPTIEFLCAKEDYGVIKEPYRAIDHIPDWWKKLEASPAPSFKTAKICSPFLDAMSIGWIIPLVADIHIKTNNDLSQINYKWMFDQKMLENHHPDQLYAKPDENKFENHPYRPLPILKFKNLWTIKVPEGYSVLFTPPLNRPDKRFMCFSGVVDCDVYLQNISLPFVFFEKNYDGYIKAGTPLVQVIPIKREKFKSLSRELSEEESTSNTKQFRRHNAEGSYYRKNLWQKKIKNYQ